MRETTGVTVEYEDIWTFDFTKVYGVSHETMTSHIHRFCHNYHDNLAFYPGAIDALRKIQMKASSLAVTARKDILSAVTHKHLANNGAGDLFSEVRFTNLGSKLDICRKVNAVAIVDDAPHNAIELAAAGIETYMPRRPWNRMIGNDIPNLTPVSCVTEAILLIEQRFSL
jgi:hypothetical protein